MLGSSLTPGSLEAKNSQSAKLRRSRLWKTLEQPYFISSLAAPSLTIDDSGHPPETQQDQEAKTIEGVFVKDEDNVQQKGNHHDKTVKHLKLVIEELKAVGVQLPHELHHEKGEKSQAEVVENLQRGNQGVGESEGEQSGEEEMSGF